MHDATLRARGCRPHRFRDARTWRRLGHHPTGRSDDEFVNYAARASVRLHAHGLLRARASPTPARTPGTSWARATRRAAARARSRCARPRPAVSGARRICPTRVGASKDAGRFTAAAVRLSTAARGDTPSSGQRRFTAPCLRGVQRSRQVRAHAASGRLPRPHRESGAERARLMHRRSMLERRDLEAMICRARSPGCK
jgi:hypothetical protein